MKRARDGAAMLWLLVLLGLTVTIVGASLSVSRSALQNRVTTLERTDGMFYAEVAVERAVAFLRQNTNIGGELTSSREFITGNFSTTGAPMRYRIDLGNYNSTGPLARSIMVTVTPDSAYGPARPLVARTRLREDLSVGEWFVLDHDPGNPTSAAYALPKFASCTAVSPRVTSGSTRVSNEVRWSWGNSERPDRVRVSWRDFRAGSNRSVEATASQLASGKAGVTTPFPRSPYAPVDVPYTLEAFFEGRLVDSCVVDVVSGRFEYEVHPRSVCSFGDTVTVTWRANAADSQVQVRTVERYFPFTTRRIPRASGESGSLAIPVVRTSGGTLLLYQVELIFPSSVGGTQRESIALGC